jgi:hypothetical protein
MVPVPFLIYVMMEFGRYSFVIYVMKLYNLNECKSTRRPPLYNTGLKWEMTHSLTILTLIFTASAYPNFTLFTTS